RYAEDTTASRDGLSVLKASSRMENRGIVHAIQTFDHFARGVFSGIATGGHHDANGALGFPPCGARSELPVDRGFEEFEKIGVETRQQDLRLRIAETAIELE